MAFATSLSYPRGMLLTMQSGTDRKGRGAFYTPSEIVVPMVRWAIRRSTDAVLDGGAGESAFLVAAAEHLLELGVSKPDVLNRIHGVELDEAASELAAKSLAAVVDADPGSARILRGSFFDVKPGPTMPVVDACIGNPPYIRYQSFSGDVRKTALARAAEAGVKLNGLASSWAAFLVHATRFVSPEGRLAQVLPAELLHTAYAQPVRDFLAHRFNSLVLVTFDARVFPGALEEVVLLLAANEGPRGLQVREATDLTDLEGLIQNGTSRSRSVRRPKGKWSKYLLQHAELREYEATSRDDRITRLSTYGSTDIGVVTGANKFFLLTDELVRAAQVPQEDLTPAVAKAEHVQGLRLRKADLVQLREADEACWLLYPRDRLLVASTARYVASGEAEGLHERYKCRNRNPWWRVPGVRQPDLFITYMASDYPRVVLNDAGAISTNTVHRFFIRRGHKSIKRIIPVLAMNSLTLLSAEIEGRSYGGGVLKLEPKECDALLVPRIEELTDAVKRELLELSRTADVLIREGKWLSVVDRVDKIVLERALGLSPAAIARIRRARLRLHDRRVARMRSKPI